MKPSRPRISRAMIANTARRPNSWASTPPMAAPSGFVPHATSRYPLFDPAEQPVGGDPLTQGNDNHVADDDRDAAEEEGGADHIWIGRQGRDADQSVRWPGN